MDLASIFSSVWFPLSGCFDPQPSPVFSSPRLVELDPFETAPHAWSRSQTTATDRRTERTGSGPRERAVDLKEGSLVESDLKGFLYMLIHVSIIFDMFSDTVFFLVDHI